MKQAKIFIAILLCAIVSGKALADEYYVVKNDTAIDAAVNKALLGRNLNEREEVLVKGLSKDAIIEYFKRNKKKDLKTQKEYNEILTKVALKETEAEDARKKLQGLKASTNDPNGQIQAVEQQYNDKKAEAAKKHQTSVDSLNREIERLKYKKVQLEATLKEKGVSAENLQKEVGGYGDLPKKIASARTRIDNIYQQTKDAADLRRVNTKDIKDAVNNYELIMSQANQPIDKDMSDKMQALSNTAAAAEYYNKASDHLANAYNILVNKELQKAYESNIKPIASTLNPYHQNQIKEVAAAVQTYPKLIDGYNATVFKFLNSFPEISAEKLDPIKNLAKERIQSIPGNTAKEGAYFEPIFTFLNDYSSWLISNLSAMDQAQMKAFMEEAKKKLSE